MEQGRVSAKAAPPAGQAGQAEAPIGTLPSRADLSAAGVEAQSHQRQIRDPTRVEQPREQVPNLRGFSVETIDLAEDALV